MFPRPELELALELRLETDGFELSEPDWEAAELRRQKQLNVHFSGKLNVGAQEALPMLYL